MLNLEAMGLVYATLLSLVPLLAVAFSLLKAFGAQYQIEPLLAQILAPLGPGGTELSERVTEFVSRMRVGVLGAVGVAGLFYTVMSLIERIENALNRTWQVRRSRSLARKFSDYLSFLLVGPVLVFAAFALIASAQSHWIVQFALRFTGLESPALAFARHGIPLAFLAAAFTFLYKFLPYTHVEISAAIVGGVTAAVLWQIAGVAFAALVAGSASYAAIYSSFAVLILFLIWLHVAWLVVMIGGEVAHAYQRPSSYLLARTPPGLSFRERLALSVLAEITRRHLSGQPPYTVGELCQVIDAPLAAVEELVDELVARRILARAAEPPGIMLARAPELISAVEILNAVRDPASRDGEPLPDLPGPVAEVLQIRDRAVSDAVGRITLRSLAASLEPAAANVTPHRRRAVGE